MGRGTQRFGFGSLASRNPGHGTADVPHHVVLTRPFCIDAGEVSVLDYRRCVESGVCSLPDIGSRFGTYPAFSEAPVNMIDWTQAREFCRFVGKDLPTEAQWEWAATGGDQRLYPWGNDPPNCARADFTAGALKSPACDCGCNGGGPSAIGSHPDGDKIWPTGRIHDLAGNVWEWCVDNYVPYTAADAADPAQRTREDMLHVVRGGGWNRSHTGITTSFRGGAVVGYRRPGLGARCVRNPR
jgi:formylglycine-generating enzyme required for sulfatase activity